MQDADWFVFYHVISMRLTTCCKTQNSNQEKILFQYKIKKFKVTNENSHLQLRLHYQIFKMQKVNVKLKFVHGLLSLDR